MALYVAGDCRLLSAVVGSAPVFAGDLVGYPSILGHFLRNFLFFQKSIDFRLSNAYI